MHAVGSSSALTVHRSRREVVAAGTARHAEVSRLARELVAAAAALFAVVSWAGVFLALAG